MAVYWYQTSKEVEHMTFNSEFEKEVYEGLTATEKHLSSKWFYDDVGSKIFQQIMQLSEYYPTRCEYQIFEQRDLISMLDIGADGMDIIELGAGDGLKTKLLLKKLQKKGVDFAYRPIDISGDALRNLQQSIETELPGVAVRPLEGEYFAVLDDIKSHASRPKVILFLGSNIGNLLHPRAIDFLSQLASTMGPSDKAMIGFDLKKDPNTILAAYNDETKVTASFNKNLLRRINKELDADFDLDKFTHYPVYNPETGTCFSYLVSTSAQRVHIKALDLRVMFYQWETIHTEISQKYTHRVINWLLSQSGLSAIDYVTDDQGWFAEYVVETAKHG